MDWWFTFILIIAGVAFFCGWQFALVVDPEDFRVAGYVLGGCALFLLLFGAGVKSGKGGV